MRSVAILLGLAMVTAVQDPPEGRGLDARARARLARLAERGFGLEARGLAAATTARIHGFLDRVEVVADVALARPDATPATRPRYSLVNDREDAANFDPSFATAPPRLYPHAEAVAKESGREPLPILLVPGAADLAAAVDRTPLDAAASGLPWVGRLDFEPLPFGRDLVLPCAMPERDLHGPIRNPTLKGFVDVGALGMVLGQSSTLDSARKHLKKLGHPIIAETIVVASSAEVWVATLRDGGRGHDATTSEGAPPARFAAVPIADANGAAREGRAVADREHGSPFRNLLVGLAATPRLGSRSASILPRPLPPDGEELPVYERPRARWRDYRLQERVVLTDADLRAASCFTLRRAPTWKPFMEDAVLEAGLGTGSPRLSLVVSLDASDRELVDLVATCFAVELAADPMVAAWLARGR